MRARPVGNLPVPVVAGRDPQLGHIFRTMRAATRLTRENIARRLATTPAIIEDLENGAVSSLPHWRETVRIVRSYCELLRLDPEPLLWRFQQLLQSGTANGAGHELAAARPPSPPPLALRAPPLREPVARRGGGLRKVLLLAAMPIAAATLILLAALAPAPIYRAISLLPASLAEPARAGMDSFVLTSARREKGLRWIDVGDPQLRKVDKLPTKPR